MVHYTLDASIDQLYPPSHSNSSQYKAALKSMVRKLKKKGLLKAFDDQMVKLIDKKHAVAMPLFQWHQLRNQARFHYPQNPAGD